MGEAQSRIVDTVQAKLDTHIFDENTFAWLHLLVSDAHNEAINTFVFVSNDCLGEYDCVVSMTSSIGNPELLGKCGWRVNCEFLGYWVVVGGGLHFWSVVAVAELGKTEAPHVL